MATLEIRQRYTRSTLGPFWITLSMGVTLLIMGPLYSNLFKIEMGVYFLNLSIGMVLWTFISGSINDFCQIYIISTNYIRQIKIPYSFYIFKVIAKNLIILIHNLILIIVVLIIFSDKFHYISIIAILGLFLIIFNLFWLGLLVSLICTRFRDINQLVSNALQIIFFATPIVWMANSLNSRSYLLELNFFYHLIEVVRLPLLGLMPQLFSYIYLITTSVIGYLLAFLLFAYYRSRISFWI